MAETKYFFYNAVRAPLSENEKMDNPDMIQFFEDFDPINRKYGFENQSVLSPSAYAKAEQFEDAQRFGELNKQEYSYLMENLKLVYGSESSDVIDDIRAFHLAEDRIIRKYLGIPQLHKMFDEDYFNFEWDMHVGQNFIEHRNQYYRDHFIHQIRNLFMMIVLLDRFQFYEASAAIFKTKDASKISEYVYKKWQNFRDDECALYMQTLKKVYAKECMESSEICTEREYIEKYYFRYVIYASAMMSALFHDMGYPICHFLEVRHRVSNYNPTLHMFTHNSVESFDQLASKLGSSLLFTVVSPREINRRLEFDEKKEQFDHGAYSAIAFLLQFYESGIIFSLSPEKQCAIELAAVAIYNHTSKFKAINKKNKTSYNSMRFRQNPISFLLRFCDDLQEWDRRYFEISNASDLMFCPDCGSPLLKIYYNSAEQSGRDSKGKEDSAKFVRRIDRKRKWPYIESYYRCNCSEKRDILRPNVFSKRKLFLVSVADWVKMSVDDQRELLQVRIDYDPYKLLLLSFANRSYAKHRLSELNEIKRLMKNQNFKLMSDGKLSFHSVYLDYFMSPNPLLIKLKILEVFLREGNTAGQPLTDSELIEELNRIRDDQTARESLFDNLFEDNICNPLKEFLCEGECSALRFYASLLQYCLSTPGLLNKGLVESGAVKEECEKKLGEMDQSGANKDPNEYNKVKQRHINAQNLENALFNKLNTLNGIRDEYIQFIDGKLDGQYLESMQILTAHCVKQYEDLYICSFIGEKHFETKDLIECDAEDIAQFIARQKTARYWESYEDKEKDDELIHQISIYTNANNLFNQYPQASNSSPYIGFFEDIYFFFKINEKNHDSTNV